MARTTGTVKWFNDEKGYGFIARNGAADVFVHYTGIRGYDSRRVSLHEGNQVEFDVVPGLNGEQAQDVVVIG